MLLPLLLILGQDVSPDEVTTPNRLFARPCRRSPGEITVCGDQARAAERYRRKLEAKGDPMTRDKRPKVHIAKGWCLRVGFMVTPERCE